MLKGFIHVVEQITCFLSLLNNIPCFLKICSRVSELQGCFQFGAVVNYEWCCFAPSRTFISSTCSPISSSTYLGTSAVTATRFPKLGIRNNAPIRAIRGLWLHILADFSIHASLAEECFAHTLYYKLMVLKIRIWQFMVICFQRWPQQYLAPCTLVHWDFVAPPLKHGVHASSPKSALMSWLALSSRFRS